MKYKQKQELEFPALGKKPAEDDGFGHMVEEEDHEVDAESVQPGHGPPPVVNTLEVNPEDFEYDADHDKMVPKDNEAFEKMVDMHPAVNKLKRDAHRDEKVANLKKKVLETLKVNEKKKRDISCESVKSECLGWDSGRSSSIDSRGKIRNRSDDSDDGGPQPKSEKQSRKSRSLLKPPKIVLTQ